jgi:hypothetical protein
MQRRSVQELKAEYEAKMALVRKIGSEVTAEIASKGEDKVDRAWVEEKGQEQIRLISEAAPIRELLSAHFERAYALAPSPEGGHSSCSLLGLYRAHEDHTDLSSTLRATTSHCRVHAHQERAGLDPT